MSADVLWPRYVGMRQAAACYWSQTENQCKFVLVRQMSEGNIILERTIALIYNNELPS